MPAVGRKPKPPGQAVNRHALTHDFIELPDVDFTRGPKLRPTRPNGEPWPDGIAERWDAWSTLPHCKFWKKGDWQFALDTLVLAARFQDTCDPRLAAEVRCREKVMGTTMDFRRDIRVRYTTPTADSGESGVTKLDDYRAL